ncbi:beta family protein [Streptomyces exfoliatus]|uniref:beta family protein n=1 Tax=Streptomyces exfoliatus TaxID=1905 RepID=UPI00099D3286
MFEPMSDLPSERPSYGSSDLPPDPTSDLPSDPKSDLPPGLSSGPLYVPALPARRSALAAYSRLHPRARACVTPLWSIPPRVGGVRAMGRMPPHPLDPDRTALASHLRTALRAIETAQRGRPAWVDAFHTEDGTEPLTAGPLAAESWLTAAGTPLRPVTGVERAAWRQTAAAEAARLSGNGLGVRVFLTVPPDEGLRDAVGGLLTRIAFAHCPVDLLLDLGAVVDEHHPAEKWALRALGLLGPLHHWRTVVLLAGSFPRTFPEDYGAPLAEAHRFDWDVWHMLADGAEHPGPPVVHGDYGAAHTGSADSPTRAGGAPPWGVVRYTTERTFLLVRVPTQGPGHADTVRSLVREIVHAEGFRGEEFSEGERWLASCAAGAGPAGVGGPEAWARAGHVQHMAQVVRALRRRL